MSARNTVDTNVPITKLQDDLKQLKRTSQECEVAYNLAGQTHSAEFDQLSPIEQSAASLGVNPVSFKPISFMNNGHYNQLIKANRLDDNLARRIEVGTSLHYTPAPRHTLSPDCRLLPQAYRSVASN